MHDPYKKKQCSKCHNQSGAFSLVEKPPDLCYKCHQDYTEKYKVVHGPLFVGGCIDCHDPHSSPNKHLLLRKGQELCLFCHQQKDIMKTKIHLTIGKQDCKDCHNPHGGEDRTFRR